MSGDIGGGRADNYRYSRELDALDHVPDGRGEWEDDRDERLAEAAGDGQVVNFRHLRLKGESRYDAGNSFMLPYSKRSSSRYDDRWSEWRNGKPFHSHEWPNPMDFAEQLTDAEARGEPRAASHAEFWGGEEDPWDYYRYYKGTPHENLPDTVDDPLQSERSWRGGANVYDLERRADPRRNALARHEEEAASGDGDGDVYARTDDVRTVGGRERFVRMEEKITPTVLFQAPRSDRETSGRPIIEYMRLGLRPHDQVRRSDLPTAAPTAAPPVMSVMLPSVRENHFGWIEDFGHRDGGYVAAGEDVTVNDVELGARFRNQARVPVMLGAPTAPAPGVGDSVALNAPVGGRVRSAAGGHTSRSLWGDLPHATNAVAGWDTRVDDSGVSGGGRVRSGPGGDTSRSLWGDVPSAPNSVSGWDTRVDDSGVSGGGRVRSGPGGSTSRSLWGDAPAAPNAAAGWDTRVDDSGVSGGGRVRSAAGGSTSSSLWGDLPKAVNAVAGWDSLVDDVVSGGRVRTSKMHELWGANPAAPAGGKGDSLEVNDVAAGARVSDRGTDVDQTLLVAGAPVGAFGGVGTNLTTPESHGRRPETIEVTGVAGAPTNAFDGFLSSGAMKEVWRPDWCRTGAAGGPTEGAYIADTFNLSNYTNSDGKYYDDQPDEDLLSEAMKGLGSKTICDMANVENFKDLQAVMPF